MVQTFALKLRTQNGTVAERLDIEDLFRELPDSVNMHMHAFGKHFLFIITTQWKSVNLKQRGPNRYIYNTLPALNYRAKYTTKIY